MTKVKGPALISTLRFLTDRFGKDGLAQVRADLSPEERAALPDAPLANAWYPFSLLMAIGRAAGRRFGGGLADFHRDLGRASAEYGLKTIYRVFLKLGSPQSTVIRATRVFGTYFDSGEMRAVVSERGHAAVELAGFADPTPEFCERLLGFTSRTVELAGGKDLRAAHTLCVHRGDAVCRFEGWWK